MQTNRDDRWPELVLDWQPTYETLHRWTQIIGKTRLALAPFENHWWHCALYLTARGLTLRATDAMNNMSTIQVDAPRGR